MKMAGQSGGLAKRTASYIREEERGRGERMEDSFARRRPLDMRFKLGPLN